jgi:hypothetical protein
MEEPRRYGKYSDLFRRPYLVEKIINLNTKVMNTNIETKRIKLDSEHSNFFLLSTLDEEFYKLNILEYTKQVLLQ